MVNEQLIHPQSIVVVGASNDLQKPGGKVLKNLLDHQFKGCLYAVNPNDCIVQGLAAYPSIDDLPLVELAILAIPAKLCVPTVEALCEKKQTKAIIVFSAGFSEESPDGRQIEDKLVEIANKVGACLIGPNCIGVMNSHHSSVFTTPVPPFVSSGCDLISASGATALFIIDLAITKGLRFNSVFSVGNSAQTGVEEVLEYLDKSFEPNRSSPIKLLYLESIRHPYRLYKAANSLIKKGCRIVAVKAGYSEVGSKAASSHTGALANSDSAVDALFRKSGIIRCFGRDELTDVAAVLTNKPLKGRRIAVVTHAGGPAVMLTDVLCSLGMEVPRIDSDLSSRLSTKLYSGSSVTNPIDFLATGTAAQLGLILDFCENEFENIDGVAVIFGSPGLASVFDAYRVLDLKIRMSSKPIYAILPSLANVFEERADFLARGNVAFAEEVNFGRALAKVCNTPFFLNENEPIVEIDQARIREIIDRSGEGYLSPMESKALLEAIGINCTEEFYAGTKEEALKLAPCLGYPLALKAIGPVHKSDVSGVILDVGDSDSVVTAFDKLIKLDGVSSILMQKMVKGSELFIGAEKDKQFGHLVFWGFGGVFVELIHDVVSALLPLTFDEISFLNRKLQSHSLFGGFRGQGSVNESVLVGYLLRISRLLETAPEIAEMDLNPLKATDGKIICVDSRIRVEK